YFLAGQHDHCQGPVSVVAPGQDRLLVVITPLLDPALPEGNQPVGRQIGRPILDTQFADFDQREWSYRLFGPVEAREAECVVVQEEELPWVGPQGGLCDPGPFAEV